jgi:hypothetical protein
MASNPTYYWDACLFYEVLGDETVTPQKKAGVQQLLEANKSGENVIVTSVITHLEIIPAKLEAKKPGAAKQYLGMFVATARIGAAKINLTVVSGIDDQLTRSKRQIAKAFGA